MHEPLETYLQEVKKQLKGLPRAAREEEISEIRLHLHAIINESIKRGSSEDDAVKSAIAQFGDSQEVGRNLKLAWDGPPEEPVRALWAGLSVVIGYYGYHALSGGWTMFPNWYYLFYLGPPELARVWVNPMACIPLDWFTDTRYWWLYSLRLCAFIVSALVPFFSGWIARKIAPRRATLAIATVFLTPIAVWALSRGSLSEKMIGIASLLPFWLVTYAGAKFCARWKPKRAVRAVQQ